MNIPKTFLMLTPGFPDNDEDSVAVPFIQSFVKNFHLRYPEFRIVVLAFQYPFRKAVYSWHGATVYSFNGRNRGKFKRMLTWYQVWKKIGAIVREQHVHGILSFWLGDCAWLGRRASAKFDIPGYIWILGQDARKPNRYATILRSTPKELIALSDFVASEIKRNYGVEVYRVIQPGIDTRSFASDIQEKNIDLLAVGSLIPLKQFHQVIEIAASVVRLKPHLRVMICGEGPERKNLEQLIEHDHLQNHIELTGELPHKNILQLMQRTKILLHPSSYEGFGMVCAEALYAGAHVISYCKPMQTAWNHHYVAGTKKEMEIQVLKLLSNGNLCRNPVITHSIENTCDEIFQLYNSEIT